MQQLVYETNTQGYAQHERCSEWPYAFLENWDILTLRTSPLILQTKEPFYSLKG